MKFKEATGKIGAKTPIGSRMNSAEWTDVPVALRERGQFSAGVENVRFLQRVNDLIGDYLQANRELLPNGQTALKVGSRAQFVDLMRQFALKEGMGPLDPADAGGLKDITSERRLALIFDVQTRQAGDYGYWRQGMDADVLDEFPAQRFIRVQDVREPRTSHNQHEDQVYLKTDAIWERVINEDFGVPWGPWAWGCGHDVEDVDRDEAEKLGLIKPGEPVKPVKKFFNENLRASTKGLAPELLAKLKEVFGDQLKIEGDTMQWVSGTTPPAAAPPAAAPQPAAPPAAPAAPAPAAPGEARPAAAPAAAPAPPIPVREAPVSSAAEVNAAGSLREAMNTALAAIDKVHDDGDLKPLPFLTSKSSSFGMMKFRLDGVPTSISVRANGPWPALTTVHEVGHWLDLEAIGKKGDFATLTANEEMLRVLAAAEMTKSIQAIKTRLSTAKGYTARAHFAYLLKPEEIWARAYAQYIAERSGNTTLVNDLRNALQHDSARQWTKEDFAPIATEIEAMFRKMKWL